MLSIFPFMNKDYKSPADAPPLLTKKMPVKGRYISTAVLFLIAVFLWSDLSGSKNAQLELAERNNQLQKELEGVQSELANAQSELDNFKMGAPSKKQAAKITPGKPETPTEEPETLTLHHPSVSQTQAGLVARLAFQSTTSELPDLIALVVRIPGDSEAEILDFKAATEAAFSNVKIRVDESGTFAIFQGSPANLDALEFDLTVSAPVTATVRGSKGIKPFEIDISPDSSNVRKL